MELHAIDLLSMARLLTGSEVEAQQAVVGSIATVSSRPRHGRECAASETRRVLAALVFADCWPEPVRGSQREPLRSAETAAADQRAVVALYFYGCHSPAQAGVLLEMPDQMVHQMLIIAMSELTGSIANV